MFQKKPDHAPVHLASGKLAFRWENKQKPSVNHWYQCRLSVDYWRINKDFYCKERNITYYRIQEFYNSDIIYCGKTLAQCRELIRENTYRMVI